MPDQPASRKNILLVDDDRAFVEMLGELLQTQQADAWNVHLATSTAQALSTLRERPIDLVVLDLQMPVVDGIQFLRLIERKYPQLRKAVLSGHGDPARRAECLEHGAELFLDKPQTSDGFEIVLAALHELATLEDVPLAWTDVETAPSAGPGASAPAGPIEPGPVSLPDIGHEAAPEAEEPKSILEDYAPDVVTEEIVLCAPSDGSVLHEWQCRNVDARLKLFGHLATCSEKISKIGNFGKLLRCEVLTPPERMIFQFKSDRQLLVRTRRASPAAAKS